MSSERLDAMSGILNGSFAVDPDATLDGTLVRPMLALSREEQVARASQSSLSAGMAAPESPLEHEVPETSGLAARAAGWARRWFAR